MRGIGEFPAQGASNAENVSIWWRHHVLNTCRIQIRQWTHKTYTSPPSANRGMYFVIMKKHVLHECPNPCLVTDILWWRYQKETCPASLALCAGNSLVTGEFPSQRPMARIFDICFDLRLNKRLSKQSKRRWFETPTRSLSRHCNVYRKTNAAVKARLKDSTTKRNASTQFDQYMLCYLFIHWQLGIIK